MRSIAQIALPALLLAICSALTNEANGQTAVRKIADSTREKLWAYDRKSNRPKEGMLLPEFTAFTTDGRIVTNAYLNGKVSLLIFWDPWCNCFKPESLGALPELAKLHKDFQILSLMSDTGRLSVFKNQHPLETPVLILPDRETMSALCANNGIPSCVLVDRAGRMVRISGLLLRDIFDEQSFADKIRELLMF